MFAADFRAAARRALAGKWVLAIIAGVVASLLWGGFSSGPSGNVQVESEQGTNLHLDLGPISYLLDSLPPWLTGWFVANIIAMTLVALVLGLLFFALGSVVKLGYARFNLELVDGGNPQLAQLFDYLSWFKTAFCANFLTTLYTLLWALLLVVPGIMAAYSYSMTSYLLAEDPTLPAGEAIRRSKELMYGNRWRLFCLHFSFIGWHLLAQFTFGLGRFVLNPYMEAANACFYRDLTTPAGQNDPPLF